MPALRHKPTGWVVAWFLLSSILVTWDVGFIFMRPRSFPGGDLSWIWAPYINYYNVDLVYGRKAWDTRNGFPAAQSLLNVIETIFNFTYLGLAYNSHPVAPLIGFTSVIATFSKTLLYMANDYFCGWCYTGHNDLKTLILLFLLPNTPWLYMPLLIAFKFAREIAAALYATLPRGPEDRAKAAKIASKSR